MDITISVVFKGGSGLLKAKLFHDGAIADSGQTNSSATPITLNGASSGDEIGIDGVSPPAGTDVTIDVSTAPPTPKSYPGGPIMDVFFIN